METLGLQQHPPVNADYINALDIVRMLPVILNNVVGGMGLTTVLGEDVSLPEGGVLGPQKVGREIRRCLWQPADQLSCQFNVPAHVFPAPKGSCGHPL